MGTLSATRGPLMAVANRASVVYTPILDATTLPPIKGTQTTTVVADDADSQDLYGIIEKVLSGGELLDDGTTDEAVQLRDTYLEEMRRPETGEQLSLDAGAAASVTLDLLGYIHRLQGWIVQDLNPAVVQISDNTGAGKLQLVLALDPNGMFSADYSWMEDNAFLTYQFEDGDRTAWDVIQELVAVGEDTTNDRTTFGIYADLRARYAAIPATVEYQHRIADRSMQVETYGLGAEVRPWNVLPARWLFLSDFLAGRSPPTDWKTDPRYMFIESVSYTAPYGLRLQGSRVGTLAQILAKKGMW